MALQETKTLIVVPFGLYGTGKTMFLTYLAYMAYTGAYDKVLLKKNNVKKQVYSNMRLRFVPECDRKGGNMTLDELVEIAQGDSQVHNTVFCFHEFHEWADSWLTSGLTGAAKKRRISIGYLVNRCRKQKNDFLLDTQHPSQMDNRIREKAGFYILCNNLRIDRESHDPYLIYTIIPDPYGQSLGLSLLRPWTFIPPRSWIRRYGALYDSDEEPEWKTEAESAITV